MLLLNTTLVDTQINDLKFATLGPIGTSSEFVTKILCSKLKCNTTNIKLFNTYEEAFETVKSGFTDVIIVANAYKGINNFYMDNNIKLIATFIEDTPPYGIASRHDFDLSSIKNNDIINIASHHAPLKKLESYKNGIFKDKKFNIKFCDSTSSAAQYVKNGKIDFCLTNEYAGKIYNLKFVSNLTNISMVWSIFGNPNKLTNFALAEIA